MVKKKTEKKDAQVVVKTKTSHCSSACGCGGFGYFLGFLGAAVYYISTASGFWNGVLGFLKALVWPAFLVYELLKFMGI